MNHVIRRLIERFGPLILVAAPAALFHYYGELRLPAAILLGAGFGMTGIWLFLLWQHAVFKPYRLIIGVNYATLVKDLKLVPAEGSTFENFTFTAISPVLFARSDERAYSSKLDLYKPIPCCTGIPSDFGGTGGDPTFFLRPARDGYQIGVHVPEGWWKIHSQLLKPGLGEILLAHDGTLTLGRLPYGYIPEHIKRYFDVISLWYRFDRRQRAWKDRLKQQGWTFDDNSPEFITHRYLVIRFSEV